MSERESLVGAGIDADALTFKQEHDGGARTAHNRAQVDFASPDDARV
jgi:hypothetical protein